MKYYIDPIFASVVPGRIPKNWRARAIFRSPNASKIWLKRATKEDSPENFPGLIRSYKELISQITSCQTFVSFGPGGSNLDLILLDTLNCQSNLKYIPIDISPLLLRTACDLICQHYKIPLCIEGDFEEGIDFIRSVLEMRFRTPAIFSILGNALGNADISEQSLLSGICGLMPEHQMLFLSIATGRFESRHIQNPFEMALWNSLRDLIIGGITVFTDEDYCRVFESIERRLKLQIVPSEVPGGTCMRFYDTINERFVFSTTRYDTTTFVEWIEQTQPLKMLEFRHVFFPESDVGIGSYIFVKL